MKTEEDQTTPSHYKSINGLQASDVIENFELNFNLGNVFKYIVRCDKKGNPLLDLKKALWYLRRELARKTYQLNRGP